MSPPKTKLQPNCVKRNFGANEIGDFGGRKSGGYYCSDFRQFDKKRRGVGAALNSNDFVQNGKKRQPGEVDAGNGKIQRLAQGDRDFSFLESAN